MNCMVDSIADLKKDGIATEYSVGLDTTITMVQESLSELIVSVDNLKQPMLMQFIVNLDGNAKPEIKSKFDLGYNTGLSLASSLLIEYANGERCIFCCSKETMKDGRCKSCGEQFRY